MSISVSHLWVSPCHRPQHHDEATAPASDPRDHHPCSGRPVPLQLLDPRRTTSSRTGTGRCDLQQDGEGDVQPRAAEQGGDRLASRRWCGAPGRREFSPYSRSGGELLHRSSGAAGIPASQPRQQKRRIPAMEIGRAAGFELGSLQQQRIKRCTDFFRTHSR
jgi:hypothetical protein